MKVNNTLYLVAYPLHVMTSWCPWPINIIRDWISYFQVVLKVRLKLSAFEWRELGSGTRFSCKLRWYSTEHDCWLNGAKSSRVQGIKWASNHNAAVRYSDQFKGCFSWIIVLLNPIEKLLLLSLKWMATSLTAIMIVTVMIKHAGII